MSNSGTRRPSYANVAAGRRTHTASSSPEVPNAALERYWASGMSGDDLDVDLDMTPQRNSKPTTMNTASMYEDLPPFFTPSYLRCSRHVQRLRHVHEQRQQELSEAKVLPPLSTSSSSANLSKLPSTYSSHRPMVQDVVERLPPPSALSSDDTFHPLPTRWNEDDKMVGLEIMADGTEVRFNGVCKTQDEAASVRSDFPMPKECGIYYFEVTILSRGKELQLGIGFCSRKANLNRLPGWETESWAYHGDDGHVFSSSASGKPYGPKFSAQDVVGCGVNFRTGKAFFTKNGVFQGTAFTNVKCDRVFPTVGMKKPGEHLRVNFGKTPFVFDIDSMVEQERESILEDIKKADVSDLHPPDDEDALIQNLIAQYLAHEGYVETAKAFSRDISERGQSLSSPRITEDEEEEDVHAIQRQRIRRSILDGHIDRAMKYIETYYKGLLHEERNRDIYFRLRCRKFIEMYRKSAAESDHTQQMELDEQLRDRDDDTDMDGRDLEALALQYGAELNEEFGGSTRPEVQKVLRDCFAVVAYGHWGRSPVKGLFEVEGRVGIAEEVNGAVLVSLGKPSSAALEKVCAQTEALLDETAGKNGGGGAAFVNVWRDFLRE